MRIRQFKATMIGSGVVLAAAVAVPLVTGSASAADGRSSPSITFFGGADGPVANGDAHWTNATSNDSDPFSVAIDVPQGTGAPSFSSSVGGITLNHVAGSAAPTNEPGFDVKSTVSGPSGGSPRLVLNFSDGSFMYLTASNMTTTWTTLGEGNEGTSPTYSSANGYWLTSCNPNTPQGYTAALTCPSSGATITSAEIVSDSGWAYPSTGYTNFVDNIAWNGTTISQPSDNSGSFEGSGHSSTQPSDNGGTPEGSGHSSTQPSDGDNS